MCGAESYDQQACDDVRLAAIVCKEYPVRKKHRSENPDDKKDMRRFGYHPRRVFLHPGVRRVGAGNQVNIIKHRCGSPAAPVFYLNPYSFSIVSARRHSFQLGIIKEINKKFIKKVAQIARFIPYKAKGRSYRPKNEKGAKNMAMTPKESFDRMMRGEDPGGKLFLPPFQVSGLAD